jgi:chemotaxis protein methyltransferase CheR
MLLNLENISFTGVEAPARSRRLREHPRAVPADGSRPSFAPAGPEDALDPLVQWVLEQAGLDPQIYRTRTMARRLASCRRQLGTDSVEVAREKIARQPRLLSAALNTLLIGVTEFYRDRAVFDQLRHVVLPELMETRLGLRVYAPGVSSGPELYSVALLLAECGALERSDLLGIDCRPDAISWARAGLYPEAALDAVPAAWRMRYFEPLHGAWRVRPELARSVQFQVANLFGYTELASWDLILFRNVAIYFDERHAARAWELLCDQLAPGGFLVTGKAEKPPPHLPLERSSPSIYRKVNS